jgi:hypothetical protein
MSTQPIAQSQQSGGASSEPEKPLRSGLEDAARLAAVVQVRHWLIAAATELSMTDKRHR